MIGNFIVRYKRVFAPRPLGFSSGFLFSGLFIHRSSRSYYVFFNYLSYYLYGVSVTAENREGECTRISVENWPNSPEVVDKSRGESCRRNPLERFSADRRLCITLRGSARARQTRAWRSNLLYTAP